jgi:hypothetical protein
MYLPGFQGKICFEAGLHDITYIMRPNSLRKCIIVNITDKKQGCFLDTYQAGK